MIDKLILKSLTEKLSLEERHQLNKWLDEDRAHRDMMEAFELYWDGSQYGLEQEKSLIYENIKTQISLKSIFENKFSLLYRLSGNNWKLNLSKFRQT